MEGGELFSFSQGLIALARGEDSDHADAAALVLADILLGHRAWLLAHKEK